MNGEGRQTEGGDSALGEGNVVRLPTDWLGPREELIPFGPRADALEASDTEVPTAEDFWSESSSAVQDALTAPKVPHRDPAGTPRGVRRSRASARAVWSQRRGWVTGGLSRSSLNVLGGSARPSAVKAGVASTALAALAVCGLVFLGGGHSAAPPALAAHAGAMNAAAAQPQRASAAALRALLRRLNSAGAAAHRGTPPRTASTHRASARARVTHRAPRTRAPTATAEPVRYTSPAPSDAASTSGSPSYATPPASSSQGSPSSSTAGGGTQSASTSQPALGANGALAPGSSPDG